MAQNGEEIRRLHLKAGTPLAALDLDIGAVHIIEGVSEPFEITVDLAGSTAPADIGMGSLIGSDTAVLIGDSYWHGIVRSFGYKSGQLAGASNVHEYRAVIVPKVWRLSLNARYRVFQRLDTGAIVQKIFSDNGLPAPKNCSALNKGSREYCTQFGESDLAFASRLIAEEGFVYRFEHDSSQSQLAIVRAPAGQKAQIDSRQVANLMFQSGLHAESVSLLDYDDSKTGVSKAEVKSKGTFAASGASYAAYGGDYFLPKDEAGHQLDSERHTALATNHVQGLESSAQGLVCRFDLREEDCKQHLGLLPGTEVGGISPAAELASNLKLVVTRRSIQCSESYGGGSSLSASIECGQAIDNFCLPVPPKPQPRGPLTGIVTALKASESSASSDPTRLVKVKFPWAEADNESCWVRVAQLYAGSGWGSSFVPRLDQEVLVEFLNGDLDRPVVVGALYNAAANSGPEYTSTQSGFKTEGAKFNELRFDDKKDAQELYLEAGKDLKYLVHNNHSGTVENDYTLAVQGASTVSVEKTRKDSTKQAHTVESEQSIELKVGGCTIKIDTQGIQLEAMGNKIKMDSGGISIEGTVLKLNSQSTAQLKANASVSVEGSGMAEVKSSGMTTIKGSMTMIN